MGEHITQPYLAPFGSGGTPIPGMNLHILPPLNDDDDASLSPSKIVDIPIGETGELVLKLPLPPGTLEGVWRNPNRTKTAYLERYPGYYRSGDTGYRDKHGFVYVMSRVDDLINVAGHRLSTASMYVSVCVCVSLSLSQLSHICAVLFAFMCVWCDCREDVLIEHPGISGAVCIYVVCILDIRLTVVCMHVHARVCV